MTVQLLKSLIPALDLRDQDFARSLIKGSEKYNGSVTPKQAYWVNELIKRAQTPDQAQSSAPKASLGSFKGVYDLFAKAKENLRFPKIRLQVSDTQPVVLSIAGPKSKVPGVINVTDGGPFGGNKWYGRVDKDGSWAPGANYPELSAIGQLLQCLAEDPAEVAADYGALTGYCCFCNRSLSDEKSTAVGYGPVCAKNFGLFSKWKATSPVLAADLHNVDPS